MTAPVAGFGLLTARTMNLGDDIQALAALSHLPTARHVVDRDDLAASAVPDGTAVVMNGWWMNYPERLPTTGCRIDPLLTSIHVARSGVLSANGTTVLSVLERPQTLAYLREHGPVGCRDHATVTLLRERGLDAYFSGCLTLTLAPRAATPMPDSPVLVIDLPRRLTAQVRRSSDRPVVVGTNWISPRSATRERLLAARHRLLQIERAHAVVTTRLHVALPSLAMGVPVLWVVPPVPDGRTDAYRSWVPTTTADGLGSALELRSAGWPSNPEHHRETSDELARAVGGWASTRGVSEPSSRDGASAWSYAELTQQVVRDWSRLDRAALVRTGSSRLAVVDRVRHRRLLVGRRGTSGA